MSDTPTETVVATVTAEEPGAEPYVTYTVTLTEVVVIEIEPS